MLRRHWQLKPINFGGSFFLVLTPIVKSFFLFILVLLVTSIIFYTLIGTVKPEHLKQQQTHMIFSYGSVFIKGFVLIALLIPFVFVSQQGEYIMKDTMSLIVNKERLTNKIYINGFYVGLDKKWGYYEYPIFEILDNHIDFIYSRFRSMPEDDMFVITVNDKFLSDYQLYYVEDNLLDPSKMEEPTCLIPKESSLSEFVLNRACDQTISRLSIRNPGSFIGYWAGAPYEDSVYENPIIVVKNTLGRLTSWGSSDIIIENDPLTLSLLNELVAEKGLTDYVILTNTTQVYDYALAKWMESFINVIMLMLVYLLIKIISQYQSVYIYFSQQANIIANKILSGTSFFNRHNRFIGFETLVYGLPIIVAYRFMRIDTSIIIAFVLIGLISDLPLQLITLKLFEKKHSLNILKKRELE